MALFGFAAFFLHGCIRRFGFLAQVFQSLLRKTRSQATCHPQQQPATCSLQRRAAGHE
jgi:hypothetical protein